MRKSYIFLSLSILWALLWQKEAHLTIVFGKVSEQHGSPHSLIARMHKYHHLKHTTK